MNLLFTSAGRRGYLLRYFKAALAGNGSIHAANSDAMASAFLEADHTVVTPVIHDAGYIAFLLRYCAEHKIRAVVPLFDIDIPVLAASADRFRAIGVEPVVSSPEVAAVCNDKWATHQFLLRNGIGTPRTWLDLAEARSALSSGELDYPVIVKPRWGMGSIAVHVAFDAAELEVFHARVQREVQASYLRHESLATPESVVLIQERLGGVEHGLDVVNDLHGKHCATIVKRKLAMRSGETDSAATVDEPRLVELGAHLAGILQHRGNLDVDVFLDGDKIHVLEMNARFGGGYPFSHLAGVDLPRAIVHWLQGEEAPEDLFEAHVGVTGMKCIEPAEWKER
jgi:carbamoyl-phosphate synthase large subunit